MQADVTDPGAIPEPFLVADEQGLRGLLRANPDWLRGDPQLLSELGLRLDAANIVDFGPVALSRVSAAHQRESSERKRLEAMARANFAAQAQTHAAVIDVLTAVDLSDLARQVDRMARQRFGLAVGAVALEGGETPEGWFTLVEGQADLVLAGAAHARLGRIPTAGGLFGTLAPVVASVALARLSLWDDSRQGVLAFGSTDPDAFAPDMGAELVNFLARVVERTAGRWPRS